MPKNRAVFLDRDGVIVIPHFREGRSFAVQTMDEFQIYPEAAQALSRLKKAGFLLIVVTNQPDMGKGLISEKIMEDMNQKLRSSLPLDDIKICPHTREEKCACRKPKPGLLKAAAQAFDIDCQRSYMIGDRDSDIVAGQSIGCCSVFIDLRYSAEKKPKNPDYTSKNLSSATDWILNKEGSNGEFQS